MHGNLQGFDKVISTLKNVKLNSIHFSQANNNKEKEIEAYVIISRSLMKFQL